MSSNDAFEVKRYLVLSCDTAKTKRGKIYVRFKFTAVGGQTINGICWEPGERQLLEKGVVADIVGEEENNPDYGLQLNVKAFRVSNTQVQGSEFLPQAKADVDALLAELDEFITSVTDEGIRYVLKRAWEDPRWRRAPAAQIYHHAYLGGLLEHTVNLCRLGSTTAKLYPTLRRDLLIAAAVLHDLGKMEEMSYETAIDYTTEGKLLGHIILGYERLIGWIAEADGEVKIPLDTQLLLKHLLLSHHGNTSFGSPKPPQVPEAQVFSDLDGLDAHIGIILGATERAGAKEWTEKTGTGQAFYLGKKDERTPTS